MKRHPAKSPTTPASRRAFTIIELLAVIFIIGIIVSITIPVIGSTNRAGSVDSAVNEISAALTAARSIAMRDNTEAGVIFFTDPGNENVFLRIVKRNNDNSTTRIGFIDIDDRPPTYLPPWTRVAAPNMTDTTTPDVWRLPSTCNKTNSSVVSSVRTNNTTPAFVTNGTYFLIWFSSTGTIRTSYPTITSPNFPSFATVSQANPPSFYYDTPVYANASPASNPNSLDEPATATASPTTFYDGVLRPVPYIAVFDYRDAIDGTGLAAPSDSDLPNWINGKNSSGTTAQGTKARVLMFNRYTGQLIKPQ